MSYIKKLILSCGFLMFFFVNIIFSGPLASSIFEDKLIYTMSGIIGYMLTLGFIYFRHDILNHNKRIFKMSFIGIIGSIICLFAFKNIHILISLIFFIIAALGTLNLVSLIELLGKHSKINTAINNCAYVVCTCYLPYHFVHLLTKNDFILFSIMITIILIFVSLFISTRLPDIKEDAIRITENKKLLYLFYSIFFLVNVRGGISEAFYANMYAGIDLSVALIIIYAIFLLLIYKHGFVFTNFAYTVSFLVFTLGQSIFVFNMKTILPFILTSIAYLFFDVFTWGSAGYLSRFYVKPNKVIAGGLFFGAFGSFMGSMILQNFNPFINAIICNLLIGTTLLFVQAYFKELKKEENIYDFYNKLNKDGKSVLTPREREVLKLLLINLTNDQIAEKLYITKGTVKIHTRNIYKKMDVNNKKELIAIYENFAIE
ncbi:MAG: helix-turn-helix transcriptional regulator [Clostridia bacterium]|nr:helix-turn-helix transcriptional regulator [Clostridia bacterium]